MSTAEEKTKPHGNKTICDGIEVTYSISEDKLKFFAEVKVPEEYDLEKFSPTQFGEELINELDARCVHNNIVGDIIQHIKSGAKEVAKRRIAKGKEPIPGRDGRIVYLVKKFEGKSDRAEVTSVDPKFIKFFDNIEPEMAVARIYPPTGGMPGRDVFGAEVEPQSGNEFEAKYDDTIKLLPREEQRQPFDALVSNSYGFLTVAGENISVKSELILDSSVDQTTGDIDFVGSVLIKGDIKKGFTVIAKKNITVKGNVIAATLVSHEGSIEVGGDLSGLEESMVTLEGTGALSSGTNAPSSAINAISKSSVPKIIAHKDVHAVTVHNARIICGGSLSVKKELRNSFVCAGGSVEMTEAHLLGGHTLTVCGVDAKIIGSSGGGNTPIAICSDVESTPEYTDLMLQIANHEEAIEMLKLHLGPFAEKNFDKNQELGKHELKMAALQQKLKQLDDSLKYLEKKREDLIQSAKFNPTQRVSFKKKLWAGTHITAHETEFKPEDNIEGPATIELDTSNQCFVQKEYQSLECVFNQPTEAEKK